MKKNYLNRIMLWSLERFPPVQILTAFLTFSLVCIPLVNTSSLTFTFVCGTWIVFSVLLTLRVLDEHKDYESDLVAHPERLLQKNEVSLNDLRILALFFCLTSLALIILFFYSVAAVVALLILTFWGFLMTKEFFAKEWLSKKLWLYSVSHLLISPLLIYFSATLVQTENNSDLIWMMLVSFFSAFSYEVARKIKGDNEVNLKESNYVNSYGKTGPLLLFIAVSGFALFSSSQMVDLSTTFIAIYSLCAIYVLLAAFLFFTKPMKKFRQLNEAAAATVGLVSILIPISKLVYG